MIEVTNLFLLVSFFLFTLLTESCEKQAFFILLLFYSMVSILGGYKRIVPNLVLVLV